MSLSEPGTTVGTVHTHRKLLPPPSSSPKPLVRSSHHALNPFYRPLQMSLSEPGTTVGTVNTGESFNFLPLSTAPPAWGDPVPLRLQHNGGD
jgi:hypothetical protein